MKLFVYPYTTGSESAKLIAERLGALRIRLQNSTYQHKPDNNLVINWGNSNCPFTEGVLNPGHLVRQTVDKLRFFRLMVQSGMAGYIPTYWTNMEDIPDEAFPIFCRTTTTGCDGAGIELAFKREELKQSPLYTSCISGAQEFRVTLFRGQVTDIQTKLPRLGENAHPLIHTYANGWGFRRVAVPSVVREKIVAAAEAALRVSKLDFAGVDVLYANGRAYVLEVNTAMGLEGDALNRFAEAVEAYASALAPAPLPAPVSALGEASAGHPDPILTAISAQDWKQVISLAAMRL